MILLLFIILGVVLGIFFPYHVPLEYSQYLAIVILASLDSVFGALAAISKKSFNFQIFLSGFVGNSLLAALLTFIGKRLDVDLYLVALIVFGTRLFNNFSTMRRYCLDYMKNKKKS